jgi:dTDP-4-amino-4,6-dideoxygalactose transaminase
MWAEWMGQKWLFPARTEQPRCILPSAACGIGPGDEVIVPSYSFIASSFSIVQAGANSCILRVTDDHTIVPACMEALITPRTKGIVVVHLYGVVADMGPILEIARKHNLKVIEDCAQCFGGEYKGTKTGLIGDVGCFSICQSKHFHHRRRRRAMVVTMTRTWDGNADPSEIMATMSEHYETFWPWRKAPLYP